MNGGGQEAGPGEVIFTTAMTGYQEVLTDPSLLRANNMRLTYPHISNYGINDEDNRSAAVHCKALLIKRMLQNHPISAQKKKPARIHLAGFDVPIVEGLERGR